MNEAVALDLPSAGRSRVQNSPARRVPSHGTHVMATTYAIDLVPVDTRGRSGSKRDWRTVLSTEPPERFVGFRLGQSDWWQSDPVSMYNFPLGRRLDPAR